MSPRLEDALKIANQAVVSQCDRTLTDVEALIIKGAWQKLEYDQMAAQGSYATSYLSQDVGPKLWKLLSAALKEKVKKSNFKTVIERQVNQEISQATAPIITELRGPKVSPSRFLPSQLSPSRFSPRLPSTPIPLSKSYYIERPLVEQLFYDTLNQPGALVRLKAPRFMGKTTLVSRVLSQLEHNHYQVVRLSLEMADRAVHFHDLNRFLRWLCLNVTRDLGLPNQLDDYWQVEDIGAKVSCTAYFETYLLAQDDRPFVLCFDDIDLLFSHPEIYKDFFGLLRSWHEKARTRALWAKLRLVIVHSTDVYIRLQIHQSPFNVGQPLELPEFTDEQVTQLARLHHLKLELNSQQALVNLIGGHPALLEKIFIHLKTHPAVTIEQLLAEAATESSLFSPHLREQLLTLQQNPAIAQAFRQVVTSDQPVILDSLSVYQLQSMGLIKLSGNQATPRCLLYRQYFRERLFTLS